VLFVVAVALTVWSLGQAAPAMQALFAATTLAAAGAALYALALRFLIALGVRYALRWVASELGVGFVAALALVLAAYAFYQMYTAPPIDVSVDASAAASSTSSAAATPAVFQLSMPNADQLLSLSMGLLDAGQYEVKQDIKGLNRELTEASATQDAAWERLEAASADLEASRPSEAIQQAVRLAPFLIPGEEPKSFFTRTVHAGNIGTMGVAMVGNYVNNALSLPIPALTAFDEFVALNRSDPDSAEDDSAELDIS
jgi:hypothetical protein